MLRFLIVDDDPACRRLVSAYLEPYGRCDLAYDGREGLVAFRIALESGEPYDLVCLDIMMPDRDGHEVLGAIRDVERQWNRDGDGVKVIMTTALHSSRHCIRAFKVGCESYITKPLSEKELIAQVRSLLGTLPEPRQAVSRPMPPLEAQPTAAGRRPRYLIVDDDKVCRELLKEMLSLYGDCDFAYSGSEAIDAVRLAIEDGIPYDLMCLDIMMPGSSGHDALSAIRRVEAEKGLGGSDGVRVIMTTALRDAGHCVQAFREGCECYVTKPIREPELLERMRELELLPQGG